MGRGLRIGFANPSAYSLTAAQGSYALNGQSAILQRSNSILTAAQGAYALSGQTATLTPSAAPGSFAPNRPSGLTTISDRQWNLSEKSYADSMSGVDPLNWFWFSGGTAPLIGTPSSISTFIGETLPATADGNATCMAIKWPSGFSSGQRPFGVAWAGTSINVKKFYHAIWVWMPAGFDPNSNNIKWMFFARNNGRNHVFMMSSGSLGSMIAAWLALQGGGNGSTNVGGAANTKTGAVYRLSSVSNVDGCWDYRRSGWYCVEFYAEHETSFGATNGIFKSWFNGTLINHFTNITYSGAAGDNQYFDDASIEPFYGGGGGNATANRFLVIGRSLIAGGN